MKRNKLFSRSLLILFLSSNLFTNCTVDENNLDKKNLNTSNSSAITSEEPSDNTTYYIKNVYSEKYLGFETNNSDKGAEVQQWSYNGEKNQQWVFKFNGYSYRIINAYSGKAMEVSNYSTNNGALIQQWDYIGHDFQNFVLEGSASEGYKMKVAATNKLVEVADWSTEDGGKIHQWRDRNKKTQKWEFIKVENFIDTNDDTYNLSDFQIESSSHLESTTSKTTTTWDNDDDEILGTEWYFITNGDYYLKSAEYDGKRTEFKEKSGNESSLSTTKVFKYEASIDNIPENGVTIAQVHNRFKDSDDYKTQRPYLRVYVEEGAINVKETTNNLTEDSGTYYTAHGPEYTKNSKFKVQITTGNEKVNVKIETTSGTLDEDFTPNTDVDSWDDYQDYFYLKAGVYTEGYDTKPVIRFYSLEK